MHLYPPLFFLLFISTNRPGEAEYVPGGAHEAVRDAFYRPHAFTTHREALRSRQALKKATPKPVKPSSNPSVSQDVVIPPRPAPQPASIPSGKEPPHPSELYKEYPQSIRRSYMAEATLEHGLFFCVRDGWLDHDEMKTVSLLHKDFAEMVRQVPAMLNLDFSELREPRTDYMQQTSIDDRRVRLMTACLVHYGMDYGLVMRYLGGEYTAVWRDVGATLSKIKGKVSTADYNHIQRILMLGVPADFNYYETAKNKTRFLNRGNSATLDKYKKQVEETINKEERNHHIIPFQKWTVRMSAWGHTVPQTFRYKDGKGRLIWDGTSQELWDDVTMNMISRIDAEAEITFGETFSRFCKYLWNLRISYPDEEILLAFLDISACFR